MPAARTTLTEVSTALGCLDLPNLDWALLSRPEIDGVRTADWEQIDAEVSNRKSRQLAEAAFDNGQCLLQHADGLRGRPPRVLEWTGGRQPPGDQAIPADLRLDHVYLVSCKYLSKIVHNTAPARVFDGLLSPSRTLQPGDWYDVVARAEHRALAEAAASALGLELRWADGMLEPASRSALKIAFGRRAKLTGDVAEAYGSLCAAVSNRSADRWRESLRRARRGAGEALLWRILRLASGTYFVLGVSSRRESLRLRVMTPWDWRQEFAMRAFHVEAAGVGQPQVRWWADVYDRARGEERAVEGHVEVRWSHGRFAGPPEAKVYLDTPHVEVPGYVALT